MFIGHGGRDDRRTGARTPRQSSSCKRIIDAPTSKKKEVCHPADFANGKSVSRDKAVIAAGQAVKCFAKYEYEQQEWFIDTFEAVTERETKGIGTDEKINGSHADAVPDDARE